jgi:hypothetical protein
MSEIPFIASMRPEPARDQYGRYLLPDPGNGVVRAWTRATTIAHTLDDEYHLTQWKRRMVLQGAARHPQVLETVPDLERKLADAEDWREAKLAKAELDALCDKAARAAGAEDGSRLGTLLHTITEYADADRLGEIEHLVPDDLLRDLRAYRAAMNGAGLGRPPEFIERIVVNSQVDGAGTLDRILRMPHPCDACGHRLRIGDLKTQKTVDFGFLSITIQLAEYAQADAMLDDATGALVPMPADLCRCSGIVMHLPVGKASCTLYELDLIAGWEAAQAAYAVRAFRSRSKAMGRPYVERRPSQPGADRLTYLIRNAPHPDALVALWRDTDPARWTDAHTQAAAARKAQLANANTH